MLQQTVALQKAARIGASYYRHQKMKARGKVVTPFQQGIASRESAVHDYLVSRKRLDTSTGMSSTQMAKTYAKLERQSVAMRIANRGNHELMGMQGATDDMPLSLTEEHSVSPIDSMLYDDEHDYAMSVEPTASYSRRMSDRIMSGKAWPSLPQSYELRSMTLTEVEHEANMSPSARAFSEKVLFHLMRNIKLCPLAIREKIKFEELIISRVIASRRSSRLYIVWSTVTPHARTAMEPLLEQLNKWIVTVIKMNIRTTPNLPVIMWVYDHGALEKKLPKELKRQMKQLYSDLHTSNKQRVTYLKKVDTLSHKMKDVPWFMPYLWSKESKMQRRRAMGDDLKTMEERGNGGISGRQPGFVS